MSSSLTLKITDEVILDGTESLGDFRVDRNGAIAMEHEVIRQIVWRLVKGMNMFHDQASAMQTELDNMHGDIHSLRERSVEQGANITIFQDTMAEFGMEVSKMKSLLDAMDRRLTAEQHQQFGEAEILRLQQDMKEAKEQGEDLSVRLEATERGLRDDNKKLAAQLKASEEAFQRHAEATDAEMEQRLREADDAVLSLKLDLEAAQVTLTELKRTKAPKVEVAELKATLQGVQQEIEADHVTMKLAAANLGKLQECVVMAQDNRMRTEDLWRVFRQESQEVREWASRSLGELRERLREKMDRSIAVSHIEELEKQLKTSTAHLTEVTVRVEADMQRKADAGEVANLQSTVRDFRALNQRRVRQLLIGTKCLACDREIPQNEVSDETAIDQAKERQEKALYREVQRVLQNQQVSGNVQEVLQYISVRVGSPRRVASSGTLVEIRDPEERTSPAAHHLMPSPGSGRPNSRPGGGRALGPGTAGGGSGLIRVRDDKSPPREGGRSARGATPGRSGMFGRRGQGPTHGSMKAALGASPGFLMSAGPASARGPLPTGTSGFPPVPPPLPDSLAEAADRAREGMDDGYVSGSAMTPSGRHLISGGGGSGRGSPVVQLQPGARGGAHG